MLSSLDQRQDDAAAALGYDKGVFGSPFFIMDGQPFWGNGSLLTDGKEAARERAA